MRRYAEHAGVAVSYVSKMAARGAIPVLPDGSIDPIAADEARQRNTIVGRGQRKDHRTRMQPSTRLVPCKGCGEPYRPSESAEDGAPDVRFCGMYCLLDFQEGFTQAEMLERRDLESEGMCFRHHPLRGGEHVKGRADCSQCAGSGYRPEPTPGVVTICECATITPLGQNPRRRGSDQRNADEVWS
jgi:hypothetical protein